MFFKLQTLKISIILETIDISINVHRKIIEKLLYTLENISLYYINKRIINRENEKRTFYLEIKHFLKYKKTEAYIKEFAMNIRILLIFKNIIFYVLCKYKQSQSKF